MEKLLLLDDATHRALFLSLFEVAAIRIPAVALNVERPDEPDVDWEWLRDQILAVRRRRVPFPAIAIRGDGTIGIMGRG